MHIYYGSDLIESVALSLSREILFRNNSVVVCTSSAYTEIPINPVKKVIIWGEIYSVKYRNGDTRIIDMKRGGLVHLKEMFEQNTIEEMTAFLEGNYSGVMIDSNDIVVFGDKFNRVEIFYTYQKNGIVFSSDLESIIDLLPEVEYSQPALASVLSIYGYYAPKKHTIYEGVYRVGVGEYVTCRNGSIVFGQRKFTPSAVKRYSDRELHEYSNILEASVLKRASDSCNWIFLSSGWDSTSILAILVKHFGPSKVRAVIGEMLYSDRAGTINQFEIDKANKIADYFGIRLDIIPFDLRCDSAVDYWKKLSQNLKKQHIYSGSALNFGRLNDYVLKNSNSDDSIFAGEISDAIHNFGFSQYATILEHSDLGFREYSDKMASYLFSPSFFKKIIANTYRDDFVYKVLKGRCGNVEFDDDIELDEAQRRFKFFASFFLRNVRIPFFGQNNSRMLKPEGASLIESELGDYIAGVSEKAEPDTLYSWILNMYNSFFWQGGTIRCFQANLHDTGRKLKLPFWDIDLHDFLSEMPEDWGRGLELKPTKYPLKWMLENKIDYPIHLQTGPHSYLYDVNPEFNHASEFLFGSHLSSYIKTLLKGYPYESILSETYFDLAYLRRIVDDYQNDIELIGVERNDLMALAVFCLTGWY